MPPACYDILSWECIPTLRATINFIEENKDGMPINQGQKVKRYLQEKHIKNHAIEIFEKSWLPVSSGSVQGFHMVREVRESQGIC